MWAAIGAALALAGKIMDAIAAGAAKTAARVQKLKDRIAKNRDVPVPEERNGER